MRGRRLVGFFALFLFFSSRELHMLTDYLLPTVTGSLCCDSADECKTLILSLADKISDEELQELLDEMAKLMST